MAVVGIPHAILAARPFVNARQRPSFFHMCRAISIGPWRNAMPCSLAEICHRVFTMSRGVDRQMPKVPAALEHSRYALGGSWAASPTIFPCPRWLAYIILNCSYAAKYVIVWGTNTANPIQYPLKKPRMPSVWYIWRASDKSACVATLCVWSLFFMTSMGVNSTPAATSAMHPDIKWFSMASFFIPCASRYFFVVS